MAVNLSPFAGAGWQFFNNDGIPLAGGKIYTYLAGTSTPATSYTTSAGNIANSNPIILNSAGRTANQVWLTNGSSYKFVLNDANDALIGTYDNISGINDYANVLALLANTSDITLGDALIGFKQSNSSGVLTGAVARTVHQKLQDYVHVRDFGAVGNWNGTSGNDDTVAIQAAMDAGIEVDMRDGNWRITNPILVGAGKFINLGSGNIAANCSTNPIFKFGQGAGAEGFTFYGGSGIISGTADSVFEFEGSTNWSISPANYARQIRIEGLNVSSPTLNKFISMKTSVRQVFVSKCSVYTINAVTCNGKGVEVMFDKCIFFGSSGAAGTTGIKTSSALGTIYFNEGWTFSDCTVDAYENVFDLADIFVFEVTNSYVAGTNSFVIRKPTTTTHTREILIHGNVIDANINFATASAGNLTYSNITSNIFLGSGITIGGNHSQIAIADCFFESSSSGIAVTIADNVNSVTIDNLTIDNTYVGGVIMSGATGAGCSVRNIKYAGSGSVVFATRPILAQNLDFGDGTSIGLKYGYVNIPATTYAVAATMATVSHRFAKGEVGHIVMSISMSGLHATPGTQRFDVALPAGVQVFSGGGWSAGFIYPNWEKGILTNTIPYYSTADITGNVTLTNAAGSTVTVTDAHAWFSVVVD